MQAKGPGVRNIDYYLQNQPQIQPSQIQQSMTNSQSLQQQFDKFINQVYQYDLILSSLAKNSQDQINQKYFITDFYPEFILNCTYEQDEQKKTIASSNSQMMKIMNNIQKINKRLKQQLKGWYFQYGKKTKYTQTLLQENKVLRKYVSKKKKQIVKIIQSISTSSTSPQANNQRQKLIQKINELKQQNSIMLQHIKSLKTTINDRKNKQCSLNQVLNKLLVTKNGLESKRVEYQDKQQHKSLQITIKNQNDKQYEKREQYLIKQRNRLLKLKSQYLADTSQIEKQIQLCKIDKNQLDGWLRKQFNSHQKKKLQIFQQIQQYSQKFNDLKKITMEKKQQIDRNQNKIENYLQDNQNLDRKIAQAERLLKQRQKQVQQIVDTQVSVLSAIDLLQIEISQLKQQIQQRRLQQQKQKQTSENKLKQIQKLRNDEVKKWQTQLQMSRKQANKRLIEQKNIIELKKKQIQHSQSQISDTNAYIQSLLNQLRELRSKQSGPITRFYPAH